MRMVGSYSLRRLQFPALDVLDVRAICVVYGSSWIRSMQGSSLQQRGKLHFLLKMAILAIHCWNGLLRSLNQGEI